MVQQVVDKPEDCST